VVEWELTNPVRIFSAFGVGNRTRLRKPRSNANTHVGSKPIMTEDKFRNWGTLMLWNIVPVIIVHLVARLFWTTYPGTDQTNVTLLEMLFTMFVLPIYLLIINYVVADRLRLTNRLGIGTLMTLSIGLSTILHFKNWADTVGSWKNPDTETIMVMQFEFLIGFAIVGLGTLLSLLFKRGVE